MQPTSTQRSLTLGFLEYHLASLGRHWGVIGRDREMSDSQSYTVTIVVGVKIYL